MLMRVGGIILCGGRSSRMGRPKAWLPFAGELMLPRVVRLVSAVTHPVVVVAAREQEVPPLPAGVEIVRDEEEGRGPLQGLAAGLAALDGKADAAYLSSCDVPLLRPEFARRVIELLENATDSRSGPCEVAVPRVAGFFHPLAAAYRLSVLPQVRELLAANRLRSVFLFDAVSTRVIEPHELASVDLDFHSLRNLNTPEEYAAAVRDAT